jgi:hypothetical protein
MQLNNVNFLRLEEQGQGTPGLRLRQAILDSVYGQATAIGQALSFRDYLAWLQVQQPEQLDPHHAPQCTPLDAVIPIRYYRLEDFEVIQPQLEHEFRLPRSVTERHRFSGGHHHAKKRVASMQALQFLDRGAPLAQLGQVRLPKVTRKLLQEAGLDAQIKTVLNADITAYDKLQPVGLVERYKERLRDWRARRR